jgi:F420H(2)-dependent quinone reductase
MTQRNTSRMSMRSIFLYAITGGRIYRGSASDSVGILVLTTTGRKSGIQRAVSLIYIRDGSTYVVTASNGGRDKHPGWFFNVRGNRNVTLRVRDRSSDRQIAATATIAAADKRSELWARLVEAAPQFAGYERRTPREIPMMILCPVEEPPGEDRKQ